MNTELMQTPQLSTGRLLILGVSSVVLCVSFFMSVFAPFPLALSIIMYGRVKGYLTGILGLVATFLFATMVYGDLTLFGFYFCVLLFGGAIAEIILRGIAPVKGLVIFGISFILLMAGCFGFLMNRLNTTPKEFIIQQIEKSTEKIDEQKKLIEMSGDKNAIEILQLLDRPDLLASEMINSFPSYFFIGVFIMLWFNMFLSLKGRRLLFSGDDYQYTEKNLLKFKVPFGFVPVLAIGLALAVWGEQLGSATYETVGLTIVKCLGIFYFFQGFGVFSDLLNFVGLFGFFRVVVVMITIFMASYLIAIAGLFDNWFDFRKYLKKRKLD